MFRRLSEALPLSEASILALRPALNAPVLNVDFLPVGPARGAVVVFGEEWGGIGVAIGIRSNESGQVAVFRNQESFEPEVAVASVLEPALAEAERMGFLFDEDMLSLPQGRSQAMALWGRLMGEIEMPPPPRSVPPEPAATESIRDLPLRSVEPAEAAIDVDELVLDDLAMDLAAEIPLDLDLEAEIDEARFSAIEEKPDERTFELVVEAVVSEVAPAPDELLPSSKPVERRTARSRNPTAKRAKSAKGEAVAARTAALPPVMDRRRPDAVDPAATPPVREGAGGSVPAAKRLSKFRHAEAASESADAARAAQNETTSGGEALGRIPLVRVKRGRDGSKRVPYLARLLSNF